MAACPQALSEVVSASYEVRATERLANGAESLAGRWIHMDREEALHWVHHNTPLVTDPLTAAAGATVRQAALKFYSQVQQQRYTTGRSFRVVPDLGPQASIDLSFSSLRPQGLG